jgi:hypothetical protein
MWASASLAWGTTESGTELLGPLQTETEGNQQSTQATNLPGMLNELPFQTIRISPLDRGHIRALERKRLGERREKLWNSIWHLGTTTGWQPHRPPGPLDRKRFCHSGAATCRFSQPLTRLNQLFNLLTTVRLHSKPNKCRHAPCRAQSQMTRPHHNTQSNGQIVDAAFSAAWITFSMS